MEILWLSHLVPYPPVGGVIIRSYNMLYQLSKHHDVHLIAFNQKALLPTSKDVEESVAELKKICKSVTVLPIECEQGTCFGRYGVAFKSIFSKLPYTINWLISDQMKKKVEYVLESNKIDIMHCDTISLVQFCSFNKQIKHILNHHNIESDMMLRRSRKEKNIIKKLYFHIESIKLRKYEEKHCNQFDINITCSELDSSRLKKIIGPPKKIIDIPNGVDVNYYYPMGNHKIPNSLCFCGGMNWYPNKSAIIFFVKEVWPILKKEIPDIRITIIGKNPPNYIKNIANDDQNLVITGFVDDIRHFVDKSMIFVCPIDDGGGTKIKILDALAMGKAIIANKIACEGIDVEDGISVLYASTPEDYVNKIKELLNNNKLMTALEVNGRKLIEHKYSYDSIGLKLNSIYESLIAQS